MKKLDKLTNIIEAILLISGNAVSIKDIAEKLEISKNEQINISIPYLHTSMFSLVTTPTSSS